MNRIGIVLISLFLLCGCAEHFSKPGATQQELSSIYHQCQTEAYAAYPYNPVQVELTAGYYTPYYTTCSAYTCTTTGGEYVPPTYLTVDSNMKTRQSSILSCMEEHGFRSTGIFHPAGGPFDTGEPVLN